MKEGLCDLNESGFSTIQHFFTLNYDENPKSDLKNYCQLLFTDEEKAGSDPLHQFLASCGKQFEYIVSFVSWPSFP